MSEPFVEMLRGNSNSLGRTEEVVEIVLKDKKRLEELYQTYFQDDEWVRLRTSSSLKRVFKAEPEWLKPYVDKFLIEVSKIDQPSAQWTFAQIFLDGKKILSDTQKKKAFEVMKKNLTESDDWIVLNTTMQALADFATDDDALKDWLEPELVKLTKDKHGSVAKRAVKLIDKLYS